MPLSKFTFRPGINREATRYSAEGGWYACDKVRFRQGFPEKLGGWIRFAAGSFLGVCRSLWRWVTLAGAPMVGVGTHLKFYILAGDEYVDITPARRYATLTSAVSASAGSSVLTLTDTGHGCVDGDYVTLWGPDIAGLGDAITSDVLAGTFPVTVLDADTYTIDVGVVATAGDVGTGGAVIAIYDISPGYEFDAPPYGWGQGQYGMGSWGIGGPAPAGERGVGWLRVWNQRNFGEDLIFGPRNAGLYYWNRRKGLEPIEVTITLGTPGVFTMDTGYEFWEETPIEFMTTGALPTGISTNTVYYAKDANLNTFSVSATRGGPAIDLTGAQSGHHFVSIRGVDLGVIGDNGVPFIQRCMLISDAYRFVLTFGTNDYGIGLDPLLVRWSHQEDPFTWYPSATNQAGSIRLSSGSMIVAAVQTRQEIVIFTDVAIYSLQYVGAPYVWTPQMLADGISIISQQAVVVASGRVFWMGKDKFYVYDGSVGTLACSVLRTVFSDLNRNQLGQIHCGTSEGFNEVWWFYCSEKSTAADRYVVFNYQDNLWYYGTLPRSAWLDTGLLSAPIAATYNGAIVQHEQGTDDREVILEPEPIAAYITSAAFDMGDGHQFTYMWRVLPDLTFHGSHEAGMVGNALYPTPGVTMTLYPMQNSGSDVRQYTTRSGEVISGGNLYQVEATYTGQIDTRVRGRQFLFSISSDQLGTAWQLGSPRFDVRPDGRQ